MAVALRDRLNTKQAVSCELWAVSSEQVSVSVSGCELLLDVLMLTVTSCQAVTVEGC